MSRTLFTVGPVEVRREVLEAMNQPMITHRGDDYKKLNRSVVEKLHQALDTNMNILMSPASASGLLESCVRCGVKERMLGISNGSFGDRWQQMGAANGRDVKKLKVPWGTAVKGEHLQDQIDEGIEAVTLVANESSTGVFNDLEGVVEAIRKQGDPLIFIDGVTAVGGMPIDLNRLKIDALVFGSQKALALPPGLAIMAASDRLLEKAKTVPNRGYYFDLIEMKKMADKDFSLTTPPISLMYGIDFQLDRWLKEGMTNRFQRHRAMADLVRRWGGERFGLFAEEGYRSNTITVINKGDLDFSAFHKKLKERGFEISNGYGEIKETTFRIGTMGDLTIDEVKSLIGTMDAVLGEMR